MIAVKSPAAKGDWVKFTFQNQERVGHVIRFDAEKDVLIVASRDEGDRGYIEVPWDDETLTVIERKDVKREEDEDEEEDE